MTHETRLGLAGWVGWVSAVCVVALLSGCETSPPAVPTQDSKSAAPANAESGEANAPVAPDIAMAGDGVGITEMSEAPVGAKAVAFVTLVDLPMDVSLDPAWSVVDEDVFPAITSGVWRSNGLRIGLLSKSRLVDFLNALPPNWGNRRQRIWGGDEPKVLVRSRPIRAEFFADLTVPPFAPHTETFRGHTATMLLELRPQRGGFTRVTLTPQHHKPRQVIRPRSPQEKLLDGRVFEELSVTVAVPEQGEAARYLVLGLARDPRTLPLDQRDLPRPDEKQDQPEIEGETPASGETQEIADSRERLDLVLQADGGLPEPDAPEVAERQPGWSDAIDRRIDPLPLNLGRALMTTGMRGGEAQVLMIIEVRGLRG
ncbi:MAG: hypothetical protein AAGH92_00760 [Planctomycetota bacterium]